MDVEESVTPVKLQQDSWGASVSVVDIDSGPVVDFLGPPAGRRWGTYGFRTVRRTLCR